MRSEDQLVSGNVVTVEPGIYLRGPVRGPDRGPRGGRRRRLRGPDLARQAAHGRRLESRSGPLDCLAGHAVHQPVPQRESHRRRRDDLQDRRVPARQARQGWRVRAHQAAARERRRRDRSHVPGRREVPLGADRGPADAVPVPRRHRRALHGHRELRAAHDSRADAGRRAAVHEGVRGGRAALHRRRAVRCPASERDRPRGGRDRARRSVAIPPRAVGPSRPCSRRAPGSRCRCSSTSAISCGSTPGRANTSRVPDATRSRSEHA